MKSRNDFREAMGQADDAFVRAVARALGGLPRRSGAAVGHGEFASRPAMMSASRAGERGVREEAALRAGG